MLSLAIFGSNRVDASALAPGEPFIGLALFGGIEVDFTATPVPDADVFLIALFGGVTVRVQPTQAVRLGGFSLFGGRHLEPRRLPRPGPGATAPTDEDDVEGLDLPLEISAYAVFGGVHVKRQTTRVPDHELVSER